MRRRSIVFGGALTTWSRYGTNETKVPTVMSLFAERVPVWSASQSWTSPQTRAGRRVTLSGGPRDAHVLHGVPSR
ncbi:hypothetical protein ACTMTU_05235 [Streptomyces sp. OZ13]|uniref:hypothetical protein n=1 Tax=Streptomyces sp. OZ13 TaxID=3452210 RepID=UPI003F8A42FD